MQEDKRTFLTHKGMLGKYKKLEEKFGISRQSEGSNTPVQLNPLYQPFNYKFVPEAPAQPTPAGPATTPSSTNNNYDSRTPSPNRTAYVDSRSDLENRAEVEFTPAGNHISPLVPVAMPSRRQ